MRKSIIHNTAAGEEVFSTRWHIDSKDNDKLKKIDIPKGT
jgi:hypothetical protein